MKFLFSQVRALLYPGLILASQFATAPPAVTQNSRLASTKVVRIYDPMLRMPAYTLQIPENWKFEGTILRTKFGDPVIAFRAVSPDGLIGTQLLPLYAWSWAQTPIARGVLQNAGITIRQPMSPADFLTHVAIPEIRPDATHISILPEPKVGATQQGTQGRTMRSGNVRLQTSLRGAPVEEMLACSVLTTPQPMRIDSQATIVAYHAPAGKLDSLATLLLAIGPTMKPTPEWRQAEAKFMQDLSLRVNQLSTENNARIVQNGNRAADAITRQGQAIVAQGQSQSQAFHDMNAKFAEHMGDKQSMINPSTGDQGQVSNQYNHSYANQSGQVIQTNSTTYDPNTHLPGIWTQLQPVNPN